VTGLGGDAGLSSLLGGGLGLGDAGALGSAGLGGAGAQGAPIINPLGGAQLDFDAGLANMGQALQQQVGGAGGAQGLLSMVFSLIYPSLKPVLEAAIRRITVVVLWKEGVASRDFTLTQYVTNPSRSGLLAALGDAGAFGDGGALAPGIPGLPGLSGIPGLSGGPPGQKVGP
jgi:hypothetical protein